MSLAGKRILVTGSSRGIGKAVARELAARGARIVVHGPADSDELRASLAAVREHSPSSFSVTGDLSRTAEIDALFARVARELGGLDVLVNNAAAQMPSPVIDLPERDWDYVLAVNLKAPFLCAQRAARLMKESGGGVIVNVSSIHSRDPRRRFAHYSVSKAGLEQLTRCLALELADDKIRANSLVLGAVATELTPTERQTAIASAIPAGRVATSEEAARAVAFLCSDDCPYLTGAALVLDGGLTLGFCASRRDL